MNDVNTRSTKKKCDTFETKQAPPGETKSVHRRHQDSHQDENDGNTP
jgi:hypothetical protein